MFLPDLVVRSRRTVLAAAIRPAALHIRHGKIIGVLDFDDVPDGCPMDDAADAVLMPGAVDTHVQVTEGFETTTRAAAAGGVTTIVVMPDPAGPLTRQPRWGAEAGPLTRQPRWGAEAGPQAGSPMRAAGGTCFVDVGFWGGINPGNVAGLDALAADGVLGFTCDIAANIRPALPAVAKLGLPLLVHAVLPGPSERAAAAARASRGWISRLVGAGLDSNKYATYLAAHPKEAENEAIALAIDLCRTFRVRMHILHLSSSDALTPLYHARASRLPISAETCPHYLTVVAEEIPDGASTFLCDPPIRERENREYLWASLAGGLIDMVVSDHPHVSSLQVGLAATWTEAKARGYTLNQLVDWMCRAPARLAGLERKGAIDVGFDADLTMCNPDGAAEALVERTYLRGTRVYERGTPMSAPKGRVL